jgi:hypothetical protein
MARYWFKIRRLAAFMSASVNADVAVQLIFAGTP